MIQFSLLPINGTLNNKPFSFKVKKIKVHRTITILIILHEEPGKGKPVNSLLM